MIPGERPTGRGYTSHGHAITGVAQVGPRPTSRARCGGAGLCAQCSREAAQAVKEAAQTGGKHRADPEETP